MATNKTGMAHPFTARAGITRIRSWPNSLQAEPATGITPTGLI